MHPFGAVRRVTSKTLSNEAAICLANGKTPPRFNCRLEPPTQLSCVCVGVQDGGYLNTTRVLDVPFLTNFHDLTKGEELIMELGGPAKDKQDAKKRSWREQAKETDKKQKGEAAKKMKTNGDLSD